MKKKYQVFLSSTYADLKEERLEAMNALLDMECIPVGMEQFPASPLSQWEYIKRLIDMSDYYLLIIAGRYGTIDPDENISYTEKEYNYAKEKNIPIIAFIHNAPAKLSVEKYATTDDERSQIERFRNKVKEDKQLVNFYENIGQLKYEIAKTIPKLIDDVPAIGWVRADQVEEMFKDNAEISKMYNMIKEMQQTLLEKVQNFMPKWEPIVDKEIKTLFIDNEPKWNLPTLSNEAKVLLHEACKDSYGQIVKIITLEGMAIQTNQRNMLPDNNAKTVAAWDSAINDLVTNGLLDKLGSKNELFQVTKLGYDIDNELNKQ